MEYFYVDGMECYCEVTGNRDGDFVVEVYSGTNQEFLCEVEFNSATEQAVLRGDGIDDAEANYFELREQSDFDIARWAVSAWEQV